MRGSIETQARAKINLSLEVTGPRGDGFHEVVTVLHEIDMVDRLRFEHAADLSLTGDEPPVTRDRILVLKAARLLQERTGCTLGAEIGLEMGIPVGTGLGGGSSDAAATLNGLNALWSLRLSTERLLELAAELGSDVPFSVGGGCALGENRGEVVTALPSIADWWAVVLLPPMRMPDKTGRMYSLLTEVDFSDGSATRRLAKRLKEGGVSMEEVAEGMNAFERAADEAFPSLDSYRQAFVDAGAPFVRLSGSGPAFFSLFETHTMGSSVRDRLQESGHEARLARLVEARAR